MTQRCPASRQVLGDAVGASGGHLSRIYDMLYIGAV